jgi:tRNA threonylcarbamoyl adenosine modification protein (Sua5/YciO/YrdC/YwlC family)
VRTRVLKLDPRQGPWPGLDEVALMIREGGLVAFPTETVYGIALNLQDEAVVRRLRLLKGRPDEKQITVHLAEAQAVQLYVKDLPRRARKLANRFWPGPLTLVVADRHGRPTGFRVPDLPVTRELLRLSSCRVGGTSANPSGESPAVSADDVLEHFEGLLDAVVDAGPCRHGKASAVVRVVDSRVEVLREGVIPEAEVRDATARHLLFVCTANRCRSPLAAAMATELLARRLGVEPLDLLESGYRIESAGTGCLGGRAATPEAESAAREMGLELSGHSSRPLTPTLVEEADEILVMTSAQRARIVEFAPDAASRVKLLDPAGRDIPDPYGGGADEYRLAAERIRHALEQRAPEL